MRAMRRPRIEDFLASRLRQTFASYQAMAGVQARGLQTLLSGVPESTLQQYADQELPPRSDILIKLAHAANVSTEWLATGKGEMRTRGQPSGARFADVAMVELATSTRRYTWSRFAHFFH